MTLWLKSDFFAEKEVVPERFSCEGKDISPPLEWGDVPEGTKSFALLMEDPDAPAGTWVHWVLYDIPGSTRGLAEGEVKGTEGINSWKRSGYGGPCPPPGHGVHRYYFTLYALSEAATGLPKGADAKQVRSAIKDKVIAKAELMGTYERK